MKWTIIGLVLVTIFLVVLTIGNKVLQPTKLDENNLPAVVEADFIDLDHIITISKFRSGSGHDFSSGGETCRSMKHYFSQAYDPITTYKLGDPPPPAPAPETAVAIYSPVDGTITDISSENTSIGKQIRIRSANHPEFTFRLFHVYPLEDIRSRQRVTAGQRIGSIAKGQGTDIAVESGPIFNQRFISYFSVMPDSIFARYEARGVNNRSELIISKEQRDQNPLECLGGKAERFAKNYQGENPNAHEVHLSGWSIDKAYPGYRK